MFVVPPTGRGIPNSQLSARDGCVCVCRLIPYGCLVIFETLSSSSTFRDGEKHFAPPPPLHRLFGACAAICIPCILPVSSGHGVGFAGQIMINGMEWMDGWMGG